MQHMKPNSRQKFPLPHPIEYIVAAHMQPEFYEKIAQFHYRSHAIAFAASIKCFHTMIVEPAMSGVAR
jgi:hypothetical protein